MDPTRRFSDRVADYVKYRPGYPSAIIDEMTDARMLRPDSVVADIGSGTGLLSAMFLSHGHRVFGVEPNAEMRKAGERQLRDYPQFASVEGTAEATTLSSTSVDLVVAGQAFHWFDRLRAKEEFRRILRPPGWVVLVWNERQTESTPFLTEYEKLLQTYSTDYGTVDHRRMTDEIIAQFFAPDSFSLRTHKNSQIFDFSGLRGRLLSSSYAPPSGHPQHVPMLAALKAAFERFEENGSVSFEYQTKVYAGRLAAK